METGRRRRGRPKYTVLDISRVEDLAVVGGSSKEESAILESEEEKKEKANEAASGGSDMAERGTEVKNMEAACSEDFADDLDFDENLWEADDQEERGRKRDKEAEYHLFVKTHQKRRHRGTRHRARSSS